jgi:thiol-disulfide isomerase/thioredoxin
MITVVAVVARLVLAGVFAVAGAAKLVDRAGTRAGLSEFGVPRRLVGTAAVAVPLAELAVAALLVPSATAAAGAIAALALLGLFSAAVAVNLARGRSPECHCFGQLHSAPASTATLARNAVLAALAIVVVASSTAREAPSAVAWLSRLDPAELVAVAVGAAAAGLLTAGAYAFLTLMRSYGTVLVRLARIEEAITGAGIDLSGDDTPRTGLAPGSPAPWFLGSTPEGVGVSRDDLLAAERPLLLLFTSPHCGPCAALLPRAAAWQHEYTEVLTVAFACEGTPDAVAAEAQEFGLERVLVDASREIAASYEANGTPSAVLVAPDGTIAHWLASGQDEIETLVARATRPGDGHGGIPLGAEAPVLELQTLDGRQLSLADLRGRDTMLLFWNPDCGFCRSMHEDVRHWETSVNGSHPRLVVVSSGDEESTRAEGFSSTVLLDEEYAAGTAFGAGGTPMAVLIDADGRIASPVVAGADAVLELAGRPLEPATGR